jgi:hypothetical protein
LIAFPSRSTVSSNVVGAVTGSKTAATAALRSMPAKVSLARLSYRQAQPPR